MRITQQELRELLHYDPETGIFTAKVKRYRAVVGKPIGTVTSGGYVRMTIRRKVYLAHQLVWLYVHGEWPKTKLDHKNNVRNDNRISNLRQADDSQNLFNKLNQSNNTSGYKGVRWDKRNNRWMVTIRSRGKDFFVGRFHDKSEAAAAYKAAADAHHGEFANYGKSSADS